MTESILAVINPVIGGVPIVHIAWFDALPAGLRKG